MTLPLAEARRNDELISLNDSQMLRWIDELNGLHDAEAESRRIKASIREIKKQPHSVANKREIKRLYEQLDQAQFKPDYMHLVIDKPKDLHRACRGFRINGIKYVRLLGTNGGVKNSTIVFVSERLASTLRERIENGRNQSITQIPAKYEAYRALTCSGSIPVSMPRGILLVPDCETTFHEDVLFLSDENSGEPEMRRIHDYEITLDESDGYGLMLPSLAERWSKELKLDYVTSGINSRFSWTKGMVFTFDFIDFAEKVAGSYMVKDAWGNEVDIREVELVLTTSMLKLWKCYDSMEHYLACCEENHYTFGIAKTCPGALENQRALNYQFIQSYDLDDEKICELIQPTISTIRDILSEDYRKALLFLCGTRLSEENVFSVTDKYGKALMADKRMFDDPFLKRRIHQMIRKRIDDAKIGVVNVHGNYSIVSGDPYALCQSIFGLTVTGLMPAGCLYNRYWVDADTDRVAVFRAPMTCHNNIRRMQVVHSEDTSYWYRYMTTCTVFNAWDSTAQALKGMDKDGDLVFLTDNSVLVDNIRPEPTVFCAQRSGTKVEVTEDDLVRSNIASFGDDIGRTTNWITSMFEVKSQFEPGTVEYETLDYRIKCGQLYQQNAIDKAKGIISKPMPRYWYDRVANRLPDDADDDAIRIRELNLRIVADKKPYFMRYIYPALMSQYNTYMKNTNTKCLREFRMTIDELLEIEPSELTEDQSQFLFYYRQRMPVGTNDCVMNKICRAFEKEFDRLPMLSYTDSSFDCSIMKSGAEYSRAQYSAIEKLFEQHNKRLQERQRELKRHRAIEDDTNGCYQASMLDFFRAECYKICSNSKTLCDIIIDLCYQRSGSKQFVWDVVGDVIVENLLEKNGNVLSFPLLKEDGDIQYDGCAFGMVDMEVDPW